MAIGRGRPDATQALSLVIPASLHSPAIHALAHAMNATLGNVGKTVFYTDPVEANPVDQTQSLRELVQDIDAGQVETARDRLAAIRLTTLLST